MATVLPATTPIVNPFSPLEALRLILSPNSKLRSVVRLVAMALVEHCDRQGECWPSIARLSACTGLSKRAVINALAELESSAESPLSVVREHRLSAAGDRTSNRYRLSIRRAPGSAPDAPPVVHQMHQGSAPDAPDLVQRTENKKNSQRVAVAQKPEREKAPARPAPRAPAQSTSSEHQLRAKYLSADGTRTTSTTLVLDNLHTTSFRIDETSRTRVEPMEPRQRAIGLEGIASILSAMRAA